MASEDQELGDGGERGRAGKEVKASHLGPVKCEMRDS